MNEDLCIYFLLEPRTIRLLLWILRVTVMIIMQFVMVQYRIFKISKQSPEQAPERTEKAHVT